MAEKQISTPTPAVQGAELSGPAAADIVPNSDGMMALAASPGPPPDKVSSTPWLDKACGVVTGADIGTGGAGLAGAGKAANAAGGATGALSALCAGKSIADDGPGVDNTIDLLGGFAGVAGALVGGPVGWGLGALSLTASASRLAANKLDEAGTPDDLTVDRPAGSVISELAAHCDATVPADAQAETSPLGPGKMTCEQIKDTETSKGLLGKYEAMAAQTYQLDDQATDKEREYYGWQGARDTDARKCADDDYMRRYNKENEFRARREDWPALQHGELSPTTDATRRECAEQAAIDNPPPGPLRETMNAGHDQLRRDLK